MDHGAIPDSSARRKPHVTWTRNQRAITEAYADTLIAEHLGEFVAAIEADVDEELLALSNDVSTRPLTNELMIQHRDHVVLVLEIWIDKPDPIAWASSGKPWDDLYFLVRLGWAQRYTGTSGPAIVPTVRGLEIVDGLRAVLNADAAQ